MQQHVCLHGSWGSNFYSFFWGLVSLCACPCPQPVRVAGCTCIYSSACDHNKHLLHPMCCWRWRWFFSSCSWGLYIRCLRQSCAHIKSYHDDDAGQSNGLCFVCLSPGINPEWPQEDWLGSLFVPIPKNSGLNKLQDLRVQTLFTVLTGRVAQQMLSGQKTDGPNTRGTCCSY